MEYLLSAAMILIGAAVMLFGIITAKELHVFTSVIHECRRKEIISSLNLHHSMMVFFLFGFPEFL